MLCFCTWTESGPHDPLNEWSKRQQDKNKAVVRKHQPAQAPAEQRNRADSSKDLNPKTWCNSDHMFRQSLAISSVVVKLILILPVTVAHGNRGMNASLWDVFPWTFWHFSSVVSFASNSAEPSGIHLNKHLLKTSESVTWEDFSSVLLRIVDIFMCKLLSTCDRNVTHACN